MRIAVLFLFLRVSLVCFQRAHFHHVPFIIRVCFTSIPPLNMETFDRLILVAIPAATGAFIARDTTTIDVDSLLLHGRFHDSR